MFLLLLFPLLGLLLPLLVFDRAAAIDIGTGNGSNVGEVRKLATAAGSLAATLIAANEKDNLL